MYRVDIVSVIKQAPDSFGICFHDNDSEGRTTAISIKALVEDWYSYKEYCPDDDVWVYGVSFFNDATGQVYIMDSREDKQTFEELMKFLMSATGYAQRTARKTASFGK